MRYYRETARDRGIRRSVTPGESSGGIRSMYVDILAKNRPFDRSIAFLFLPNMSSSVTSVVHVSGET